MPTSDSAAYDRMRMLCVSYLSRSLPDIAKDKESGNSQYGKHEQGNTSSQRNISRQNSEAKGVCAEQMGGIAGSTRGQYSDDIKVGKGDDRRKQHGDGDDVS